MDEKHDKLRRTLDELSAQIDEIRKLDPQVAEHLLATIDEANAALGSQPARPEANRSIAARLSDAILKYEASHPDLATNLGSVVDALGQMGI
jgi:hypothetical protein